MILDFFKPKRLEPQYRYLSNPYMQIACYVMYRSHDIELGEKTLKLIEELKELLLKFDQHNKQVHRKNFDSYSPYNIWLDIGISQYINPSIDALKENIFLKRHHSEQFFPFGIGVYGFFIKTKMQDLAFNPAFPNEQAVKDFDKLCGKIKSLNLLADLGQHATAGSSVSSFLSYIYDEKEREGEIETDFDRLNLLKEPEVYPTYLVYPKPYRPEPRVGIQGAYITDNPLKTCAFYGSNTTEFFQTKVNLEDLDKLKYPVQEVEGQIEFGLHDSDSEYYNNPDNQIERSTDEEWIDTDWYYVKEIAPNTEGIPNNPLRLEDLRYPLKNGEKYIPLEDIKKRSGYLYDNSQVMIENYAQVINRYEKYYHEYLLKNGVNEDLIKAYWMK